MWMMSVAATATTALVVTVTEAGTKGVPSLP